MKRKILALMLVAAVSFSMTACGGAPAEEQTNTENEAEAPAEAEEPAEAEAEEPAEAEAPADGEKTVIHFYRQDAGNGAAEALIEAFEEAHPEYEIDWQIADSDSGKCKTTLLTAMQAGSTDYDVVCIDTVWAVELASAGYLEAMDQYLMDSGLTIADFNKGSIASGTYAAKTYAIPLYPDFGLLYFRKDIVSEEDAAKLTSGDYTFEDLLAMAEKYKGEGGTKYGLTFQAAQYEGLICNTNEWTSNFTDIEHGLSLYKEAIKSDYTPENILTFKEGDCNTELQQGNTVFSRGWTSTWAALTEEQGSTVLQDQIEVAPLPGGSCVGGWMLAVNSNSQNKEAAWDFVNYAITDGQIPFCSTGGNVPGYNKVLDNADILAKNELLSKPSFIKALENTIARPASTDYATLTDQLQIAIHAYVSDKAELDETVTKVEELLKAE